MTISSLRGLLTGLFLGLAPMVPGSAADIPGLYDTGVLADHTEAPSGSVDLHYTLLVSPDGDLNTNGATNAQDTALYRQQLGQPTS